MRAFGFILAIGLTALMPSPADARDPLARMLAGESQLQGKKLAKAVAEAERSPLGSNANPVRVAMPSGEKAYLAKLRCSDGAPPAYTRLGSDGSGPFDNIVDVYKLTCGGGSQPATAEVFMDMYHPDYAEQRAVPGFGIAP